MAVSGWHGRVLISDAMVDLIEQMGDVGFLAELALHGDIEMSPLRWSDGMTEIAEHLPLHAPF